MNCIIVDDNVLARKVVNQLISQFSSLNVVAECENPIDAFNILKEEKIDLIFLDIEMPKMSGLDFLKSLDVSPLVILITGKTDYAVEAFEYNIVDYLVTPVSEERFLKAINKAQELFDSNNTTLESSNQEYIFIKDKNILTKIEYKDILFIQALGDYVTIHTNQKKYTIRLNLRIAEDKLPRNKFSRVHRSYIVALDRVDSIDGNILSIGKEVIPIGEMYRTSFLQKLNLL